MSRRDELALKDYLEHIRQAIGRIQRYLVDIDRAGFLAEVIRALNRSARNKI